MSDTKERILENALILFSEKGYGEVSINDIADAVGIKGPSIYKHFGSKKEIFDSIISMMTERYDAMAKNIINEIYSGKGSDSVNRIDVNTLVEIGDSLFVYFLEKNNNSEFRRILSIGRYSDPELDIIYHQHYIDRPLNFLSGLFREMLRHKRIEENPELMALEFYSPILVLLTSCDTDITRKQSAMTSVEKHIRNFGRLYFGSRDEEI